MLTRCDDANSYQASKKKAEKTKKGDRLVNAENVALGLTFNGYTYFSAEKAQKTYQQNPAEKLEWVASVVLFFCGQWLG